LIARYNHPVQSELESGVTRLRGSSRRVVRQLGMLGGRWSPTGHSHSQCHALLELHRSGSLTPGELAQRLELDRSTVSRLAEGLVRRGWVRAAPHLHDGRSKALRLTAAGEREVARIDAVADEQVGAALGRLAPEEREVVVEGMALYARALSRWRAERDYEVVPIEPRDAAPMARIVRQVMTEFGAVGCGFSIEDEEVDDLFAAYRGDGRAFFVARRDGEVLGGAGIAPLEGGPGDTCELRKMYLVAGVRGSGLGRRLLERCLDEARSLGYARCYLETLDGMDDARRLYERAGFEALDGPLGETGHHGCNAWFARSL
jgi:putative acetyltransferase